MKHSHFTAIKPANDNPPPARAIGDLFDRVSERARAIAEIVERHGISRSGSAA